MTNDLTKLEERVQATPTGAELAYLLNSLALSYSIEQRHEEAVQTFERYITLRNSHLPDQTPKQKSFDSFQHGEYLQAVGRLDEAIQQYLNAVEVDTDSAGSYHRVKRIIERQGKDFQEFIDSMPTGKSCNVFKTIHWLTTDADLRSVRELLDSLKRE